VNPRESAGRHASYPGVFRVISVRDLFGGKGCSLARSFESRHLAMAPHKRLP